MKKYLTHGFLSISAAALLVGCGGGSGEDVNESPVVVTPAIETSYTISSNAFGLASDGNYLYFGTDGGEIYRYDIDTNTDTMLTDTDLRVNGLAYAGEPNKFYFSSSATDDIYLLDVDSGSFSYEGWTSFPDGVAYLEGKVFAVNADNSGILKVYDTNTGQVYNIDTGIDDICGLTSSNSYIYALAENNDIYKVDPQTGNSELILSNEIFAESSGSNGLEGIAVHQDAFYVYYNSSSANGIYKLNVKVSSFE